MKNVKLGMPTLMEYKSVRENIELAKRLNLDFLELNINMLYVYPKPEFRYRMLRYKEEFKIDFTMHYYDTVDISSPNRNYQMYLFNDMKELGETLNGIIDRLVLHIEPGAFMTIHSEKKYVYNFDRDYVYRTIDNLMKIKEILMKYNIKLVLENVPIHPFMEALYKELNEYDFEFCWDIGHDVIYNNFLFSSFREKYNLKISHLHMHNVDGMKDHQDLNNGDLNIKEYIRYALQNNIHVVMEVKDSINLESSINYFKEKQLEILEESTSKDYVLSPISI
jgi:sugar phosphate isomerase/epimerase